MVENIESQSINFTGKSEVQKSIQKDIMDVDTEKALIESTKNFNKLTNDMFLVCSKFCIKNFTLKNFTNEEENCIENCQKKFITSYAIGKGFVDMLVDEINKTDIFSNKNELNLIQNTIDKSIINNI
jgi:hypothetical protein